MISRLKSPSMAWEEPSSRYDSQRADIFTWELSQVITACMDLPNNGRNKRTEGAAINRENHIG